MEKSRERLLSALADAGCSRSTITEVINCEKSGAAEKILRKHRAALLDEMHTSQRQLDVTDYVIRFIQGKEKVL